MSRAQAPLASIDRAYHLIGVADEEFAGRRLRVEGEKITFSRYEKISLLLRTVDADVWTTQVGSSAKRVCTRQSSPAP
jgi:hypothetical protein